jgi:pantoate--beta-alanine ligase
VVATIFVNPLQFGAGEDLDRYPRTWDDDLATCTREGVDVVFAPPVDEVYPDGDPVVAVDPGPLGAELEGGSRPGHFRGVLTVVAKLFGLVRPDVAVFGEKDYQQLALIRRMAADLCLGVEVIGAPTVREPDGLALSSRNRYLSESERRTALSLSRALATGDVVAGRALLDAEPGVSLDYLERVDSRTFEAAPDGDLLVVAARVGTTRLIDNRVLKEL